MSSWREDTDGDRKGSLAITFHREGFIPSLQSEYGFVRALFGPEDQTAEYSGGLHPLILSVLWGRNNSLHLTQGLAGATYFYLSGDFVRYIKPGMGCKESILL